MINISELEDDKTITVKGHYKTLSNGKSCYISAYKRRPRRRFNVDELPIRKSLFKHSKK